MERKTNLVLSRGLLIKTAPIFSYIYTIFYKTKWINLRSYFSMWVKPFAGPAVVVDPHPSPVSGIDTYFIRFFKSFRDVHPVVFTVSFVQDHISDHGQRDEAYE